MNTNIKISINKTNSCIICSKKLTNVASLPNFPITEFFFNKKKTIKKFNLNQNLMFCKNCKHISLRKIINQNFLYKNYKVRSKTSAQYAGEYLTNFLDFIKKNTYQLKTKAIIDIGGNDSLFLNLFKNKTKINIDPNASGGEKIILEKKFYHEVNFLNFKQIDKIYVSSHTIEHIPNAEKLIKKISDSMRTKDILYLQYPSLEKFINNSRFDQITHQHLNLYSLKSMSKILNRHSLFIKKYEYDDSVYGTIRLKIAKSKKINNYNVKITSDEIKTRFYNFKNYYKVMNDILKNEKNLIGFGAGIMVPTLNYYLPIVNNLKFIFDSDLNKKNKYFINMNPKIKYFNGNFNLLKKYKVLITSISTENTLKKICKKLIENKVSFFIPSYKI